jgi:curved DNA-binding protein CbpA
MPGCSPIHGDSVVTGKVCIGAPRVVEGVDVRGLPIGPEEAFVLSRIDGTSSEVDIASATGLNSDRVAQIMVQLAELGAIVLRTFPVPSGAYRIGPMAAADAELDEAVELDPALGRQLLDLHRRLKSMSHYELLGVEPLADTKSIKAAFYELARVFHPDRHFGKNLGSYRPKLGQVFARLTEAYDVLTRRASRAEYDAYLAARRGTGEFRHPSCDAATHAPETATICRRSADSFSEPPPTSRELGESTAPSSGAFSVRPRSIAPDDPRLRRRGLARKLGHSSAPPASGPRSTSPPASVQALAAEQLQHNHEQHLMAARQQQLEHYVALATDASARNDPAGAVSALRVARSLAPEDPALAERLADVERRAAAELWEDHAQRADDAARDGRPAEAARLYQRAALGHPSAHLFERAAFFTLEASGDLKQARELARRAVSMAPQSVKCRLTLAQVYVAAKLRESALAELERARELDPTHHAVKDWIRRVQRSDV